jgi:RNA polymerase sigma factor (sigma-70 family)
MNDVTDWNRSDPSGQYRTVDRGGPEDVGDDALITTSLEDPQAFGRIFDRHAPMVHRFLTSRVGTETADDLLSDVFVVAFRSRRRYDTHFSSAAPWLLGIAANVVRHHHRSEHRRSVLLSRLNQDSERPGGSSSDLGADIIDRADFDLVRHAVAAMDERYRDVLILYAAFGLTYAEIATALGLRVGTVRSRLSRGRVRLRELLSQSGQYVAEDDPVSPRDTEIEGTAR